MTSKRILVEDDEPGPSVSEVPGAEPAGTVTAMRTWSARHRVALGSLGVVIVALFAWRWAVGGSSQPAARPSSAPGSLEITVLGVHNVEPPAPAAPALAPAAAVDPGLPAPAAAAPPDTVATPTVRPRVTNPTPARATAASRPALVRAPPPSGARPSPPRTATATAAAKPPPADERIETAPAKPTTTKPDGPPLETNPYVYK